VSTVAGVDLYWAIHEDDVVAAITKMELLLGPDGLAGFLGTSVGPYLRERTENRFVNEGDDVTGPWAPLHPATVAIREASFYNIGGEHPINRRSGELEDWVTQGNYFPYPTGVGASMQYPSKEPSGELRDKLTTAQKGRANPNTVARPVLGVNEKDLLFVMAALAAAVEVASK
jgi:hypothetical protein